MPKQNDLPTPVTVNQRFLAKAAGMEVELPTAITMDQMYLQAIAEGGGSVEKLKDVAIENPENGEVLKYDAEQEKWVNGTVSGGGGTSDYTDLTNKPKINGVTLAGNKSLSEIGAADASETYTDAEVDGLLAEKADADDVYTKNEVDTELAKKVDKVSGKGLSTNDFTDAYKNAVDGAAPQSTTYTKTEVDAALAAKLNISDVDAALSDTSTNPVQNKAVQEPIARLVDAGAKNLLHIDNVHVFSANGVTFTVNPDETISTSGTATGDAYCSLTLGGTYETDQVYIERFCNGNHMLAGCPAGGSYSSGYSMYAASGSYNRVDEGNGVLLTSTGTTNIRIIIMIRQGTNADGLVFKPMICTAEDWKASNEFTTYAPTNRELYETGPRKKSIRHNFTTLDYEEIPECSVTVPPNKMALIVASLKWNYSYPRGIKMSTGSISQPDRIFGIAESEENYSGITAHGLVTNTTTNNVTVLIYAKSSSAAGNDVNIVYWIL